MLNRPTGSQHASASDLVNDKKPKFMRIPRIQIRAQAADLIQEQSHI